MANEFSRPLLLAHVPSKGQAEKIEATPEERAALAGRFGLPDISILQATVTVKPMAGGGFSLKGRLRAAVTQSCVVSLEPVPETIDEAVDWRVFPGMEEDEAEAEDDLDGPDRVEAPGGVLDLGEELAQQLSLALDPYPRAPDAKLGPEAGDGPLNPFAALKGLQGKG